MAAKPKSKTKSKGRGGRRPGAGRPSERGQRGINWAQIRRYARWGADRDRIITAMGIDPARLRDPEFMRQLQSEIERGHAQHDINLLGHAERLRCGGDGSVNAVLAALKHRLGYNSNDSNKKRDTERPDDASAVAELVQILRRVR